MNGTSFVDFLNVRGNGGTGGNGSGGALLLETNVTPPIVLTGNGPPSPWLAWLRPTVRGALPALGTFEVAPYGPATPGVGAVVFWAVLTLASYGAWRLLFTRR